MPFAIIQKELTDIPTDVLTAALRHVPWLTKHDAHFLARDAFGVLVGRLSFNEASSVQAILAEGGVETEVVDQSDIPTLPPPKTLPRIDCLVENLLVYDALNRPKPIDWSLVRVIAAGLVTITEIERTSRQRVHRVTSNGVPIMTTEFSSKERPKDHLVVEILVEAMPPRYQARGDSLHYGYLGARQSFRAEDNFMVLLADLHEAAPHAVLSRGAEGLLSEPQQTLLYPNRHAFDEEIAWLLFQAKRARGAGG